MLAELKVIGCCRSHYSPRPAPKGRSPVQVYADKQTAAYLDNARDADRDYVGVAAGVRGPVEAKMREFGEVKGLVFGAFGEASAAVHELVQIIAEARLEKQAQGAGVSRKALMGQLVSQVRKALGVQAVRAQAQLLLDRLHQVEGSQGAMWTRELARSEGLRRSLVVDAEEVARCGLRGVHRGGQPLVSCP